MATTTGIKTTGVGAIDAATAEIAGHVRDGRTGSHVRWTEQDHYDTAMDLRDRILAGTVPLTQRERNLIAGALSKMLQDPGYVSITDEVVALGVKIREV